MLTFSPQVGVVLSEATGVSLAISELTMAKAKVELSQEQVEELRQAFDMFDRDKGGSISTRELGYTMRAMGMNPTEAEILDLLCEVRLAGPQNSFISSLV